MAYNIIFTSDIHGNEESYIKLIGIANLKKVNALLLGGDLCPHAHLELKKAVDYQRRFIINFLIPELKKFKGDVFLIMGNDDFAVNMGILQKSGDNNIIELTHLRNQKIGKYHIVGYSFVPQMPFLLKDWEKLDDDNSLPITDHDKDVLSVKKPTGTIKEDFKIIEKLTDPKKTIYLIHTPPNDTNLDIISNGLHVGSKSVRQFIERTQPYLTLHGHIHESPDISGSFKDIIGETICINVGRDYNDQILRFAEIDLDDLSNVTLNKVLLNDR